MHVIILDCSPTWMIGSCDIYWIAGWGNKARNIRRKIVKYADCRKSRRNRTSSFDGGLKAREDNPNFVAVIKDNLIAVLQIILTYSSDCRFFH